VYTPIESGLDDIVQERTLDGIEITLSKDLLEAKNPGYQAPLPGSEVRNITLEEIQKL